MNSDLATVYLDFAIYLANRQQDIVMGRTDAHHLGFFSRDDVELNAEAAELLEGGPLFPCAASSSSPLPAETAAVTELEVNAVCPGLCPTGMNPGGTDTPRKCIETIMWLALGRRNSSLGGRVHGGFFRYKTLGAAAW